jgi:hypothetical protein
MTRYLSNHSQPPYLLGDAGERPPLLPWFIESAPKCALNVRWDIPTSPSTATAGERTFGHWSGDEPSW